MSQEEPEPKCDEYVAAVLKMYVELPETPARAGSGDRQRARALHERGVSLTIVESALLLASLRRLGRPPESPRLAPIRSLAYFLGVIDELLDNPFPDGYLDYLRHKMCTIRTRQIKPHQTGPGSEKYVSR